jgi:hypothetical protein
MLRRILLKLGIGTPATPAVPPEPDRRSLEERLTDLGQAFSEGASFEHFRGPGTLRLPRIDDLVVTSGQIVGRDPLIAYSVPAFSRRVAPGRYPVILTLAEFESGERRVTFATVQFSPHPPIRWEMATRPGEDPTSLGEDDIFGYGVDSGTGSFMDQDAARVIDAIPESAFDDFAESLIEDFFEDRTDSKIWIGRTLDPDTGANLVAFSSGLGDDLYASYWGFDADDEVVCLTTDFNMYLSFGSPAAGSNASEGA